MEIDLVSILIPVYNREKIVAETIESALAQTYTNIEIIIVDNNSTDNTWRVLQEYETKDSRVKIFKNPKNIGPVRNWQKCIEYASGKYSKILFSDDLISENYIEESLKSFDSETAFVLSKIVTFNQVHEISRFKRSSVDSENKHFSTDDYIKDNILDNKNGFPVSPGCVLFRTKDLKQNLIIEISNPFKIDFSKLGAGIDLFLMLLTADSYKKVVINTNTISYFRSHANSITLSNDLLIHYEYSKYFFCTKHKVEFLSKLKSKLLINSLSNKEQKLIIPLIKTPFSYKYLITYFIQRLITKFRNSLNIKIDA